ncbi:MAG: type II secretion system F family protein, partial [Candidatus Omnitrophica bacterium]|nr:type II secretion system F family protein [Candidatus Omnitrophota bacterium]
ADYMESEQQTNARIKQALAYPMVIVCVGILTMFVLLTFVIPRLTVMFEDLGQELPLITKALIAVSGFFASFWWLIIIVGAVIALYFRQFLSTSQGRLRFDIWRLRMPVLGSFIRCAEVGRLSRTMGTLIENGIVVNDALNSVWGTVDNAILKSELMVASTEVRDGASLNYALRDSIFFPDMALSMIAVGEETGRLDQSFH